MEAIKIQNSERDYRWVLALIRSCRDTFQMDCCRNVIALYEQRYQDGDLITELKLQWAYKYDDLHSILN